jgi:general nucleoside transport system ATP-binding protein
VQSAASTWALLRRLAENGAAVIFASADLEELMAQTGRILVFYNGALVLDTPSSAASYQQLSRAITGQVDSQASP